MSQSEENQAAAVVVKNDSQEKPPPYLKLNANCWENIYDYLSFRDIIVMGQTCKRMNRMSGCYIRDYHPQLRFNVINEEIHIENVCIQPDFYEIVGQLNVCGNDALDFFLNVAPFDSLKSITLRNQELTGIEYMEDALKHVENVKILDCKITGNIFEQLAACCPKLKQLKLESNDMMSTNAVLFKHYYPTLETLTCNRSPKNGPKTDEVKTFLEKHLNLKQFGVDFEFLLANQDVLTETIIELDLLIVCLDSHFKIMEFDEVVNILKTLYGRGFYKTLQLSFHHSIDGDADDIVHFTAAISKLPRLEKILFLGHPFFNLSCLTDLKELKIGMLPLSIDGDTLARSVPKLERLFFVFVNQNQILPFIRYSKKLKIINVAYTFGAVLDIFAMNEERKKLKNACSVLIYLDDKCYLPVQWQSKNLNLNLVNIKRLSSIDFF